MCLFFRVANGAKGGGKGGIMKVTTAMCPHKQVQLGGTPTEISEVMYKLLIVLGATWKPGMAPPQPLERASQTFVNQMTGTMAVRAM